MACAGKAWVSYDSRHGGRFMAMLRPDRALARRSSKAKLGYATAIFLCGHKRPLPQADDIDSRPDPRDALILYLAL